MEEVASPPLRLAQLAKSSVLVLGVLGSSRREREQPEHSWGDQRKKSIVQVKVKLFEELLPDVLSGCPSNLLSFHAFIALTAFRPRHHPLPPPPASYAVYSAAKRASRFALLCPRIKLPLTR